ncbi:MAG: hypothetical protein KC615_26015, partial [Anaerolineae bacterium]|nr:hypothetical protein [Anaerolineae bacterium]
MLKRFQAAAPLLPLMEVGLAGLLFVSALRFVIGELYSRTASASLISQLTVNGFDINPSLPGFVQPGAVTA